MNTPIAEYEGEGCFRSESISNHLVEGNQLEIDFDRPQFSICPSCASQVIKLADGCGVCGWSDEDKLLGGEDKLSIPCTIKQPNQPELKGIIQKVWRDRFTVYIPDDDSTISVSKLFVYPDFSKSDRQIPPTKKVTPPSKNPPTKSRRKKGDGTGYIYRRTITRRGKQYQESYYRYRDESGKLRAKYIPQRLLDRVIEAEFRKKPIADILVLLGGDEREARRTCVGKCNRAVEISRGEQFSTSDYKYVQNRDESDELISISRGGQTTPPSKRKRKQGEGTGYIECKPIKRGGKEYKQYWYHYEFWREGDRTLKKSKYIPKRLVPKVERMNDEKVSVREILVVLGMKG